MSPFERDAQLISWPNWFVHATSDRAQSVIDWISLGLPRSTMAHGDAPFESKQHQYGPHAVTSCKERSYVRRKSDKNCALRTWVMVIPSNSSKGGVFALYW